MTTITIGNRTRKGFETVSRPEQKLNCEPALRVAAGKGKTHG